MTIIRSIRAKEIAMQQRFSLNVMGSQYVLHCTVQWLLYYKIVRNIKIYKNVKDLKKWYGRSVALQRHGVVFMTVLLRNTRTYLVGLRPANLLSLHFHFLLPLIYLCVLVAVIQRAVFTLTSLIAETHCPPSYNITGIVLCTRVSRYSFVVSGSNWLP
jgi:hypothetical protein